MKTPIRIGSARSRQIDYKETNRPWIEAFWRAAERLIGGKRGGKVCVIGDGFGHCVPVS